LQDDCRSLFPELSGEALSIRPDALTTPTAQKRQRDGLIKLTERWGARLGSSSVKQGCLHADHRPERALMWHAAPHAHRPSTESLSAPEQPLPHWLLPEPQPLSVIPQGPSQQEVPYYQGQLRLLAGPHRIEAGWWDGSSVVRDYYIASSERAGLLWIFLDRTPRTESAQGPWFLHGLFG
ncbi:MAG TPA: hypothetical protein VFM48_14090, partial [Aquabacterium sp.]|nr:hypothetical protein [Aquabacterium sp.]